MAFCQCNTKKGTREMNANELADELDGFLKEQEQLPWGTKQVYLDQAATMLRQLGLAESIIKQQEIDIEEWKRKYKDMHNLATQAMSRVHELEKAQEK